MYHYREGSSSEYGGYGGGSQNGGYGGGSQNGGYGGGSSSNRIASFGHQYLSNSDLRIWVHSTVHNMAVHLAANAMVAQHQIAGGHRIGDVKFSNDGQRVYATNDRCFYEFDTEDLTQLVTGDSGGFVRSWNLGNGAQGQDNDRASTSIKTISACPTGNYICAATDESIYDYNFVGAIPELTHEQPIVSVGEEVVKLTFPIHNSTYILRSFLWLLHRCLLDSSQTELLALGTSTGRIAIFNLATNYAMVAQHQIAGGHRIGDVKFSNDGQRVYATNDRRLYEFDTEDLTQATMVN